MPELEDSNPFGMANPNKAVESDHAPSSTSAAAVESSPTKYTNGFSHHPQEKAKTAKQAAGVDWLSRLAFLGLIIITCATYPGVPNDKASMACVFFYGWVTAISTGLGIIPFLFVKEFNEQWLGVSNAIAAGMMLSASWSLIIEGYQFDEDIHPNTISPLVRVTSGVLGGILFIVVTKKILDGYDDLQFGELNGGSAHKILLFILVMTLHSFSEGVSIGVSFGGKNGMHLGHFISLSLAVHNIPEGLAVALVMTEGNVSKIRTTLWCILTSIPQPLMAIPAFLFVEKFIPLLPVGLGFAAGAMLWVAIWELLAEALEKTSVLTTGSVCAIACALMFAAQNLVKQML